MAVISYNPKFGLTVWLDNLPDWRDCNTSVLL